jgi:hypothetical protein
VITTLGVGGFGRVELVTMMEDLQGADKKRTHARVIANYICPLFKHVVDYL